MRPPEKEVHLGLTWARTDLEELKIHLKHIAREEGIGYARELLDHGYKRTMMTGDEYTEISIALVNAVMS